MTNSDSRYAIGHYWTSVLDIYGQKFVAEQLKKAGKREWSRESLNRWVNGKGAPKTLTAAEEALLRGLLPSPPAHHPHYRFRFIDLFAGIGGIRSGFEAIGGQCVFTSEWNKNAVRTYKANWYNDSAAHTFNQGYPRSDAQRQPGHFRNRRLRAYLPADPRA